jgi:hypothetical protein
LFCITTDNAGNNATLCENLEKKLKELGILPTMQISDDISSEDLKLGNQYVAQH